MIVQDASIIQGYFRLLRFRKQGITRGKTHGNQSGLCTIDHKSTWLPWVYHLASTDLFEATDFLFSLYLRLPMEIRGTKVKIVKREEGEGR